MEISRTGSAGSAGRYDKDGGMLFTSGMSPLL
jgi:hypothetical protein